MNQLDALLEPLGTVMYWMISREHNNSSIPALVAAMGRPAARMPAFYIGTQHLPALRQAARQAGIDLDEYPSDVEKGCTVVQRRLT
jgi:hypothetical protein